jgi:iron complex transport system substrate-binding protein
VEIAIVLCSLFLVALPTIAAEQNQEMQKASASEVTTASKNDYVLGIYGNANEDDTIDMRDLTYVKLIFFGKKPETELADAKYDGKINPLDFIQIKLIIVGKEKELTLLDGAERIVTVKKPVTRVVVTFRQALELIRTAKLETDRIVGVSSLVKKDDERKTFFPEFQNTPSVGYIWAPDCEAILDLHPDVVFLMGPIGGTMGSAVDAAQDVLESAGITVIRVYGGLLDTNILEEAKKYGYIFGKQNEADEFIDWYASVMNPINERVEEIPKDDKPKVYFESWSKYNAVDESRSHIRRTGGKDIFPEMKRSTVVDPESVIEGNPDIVLKVGGGGYLLDVGDTAEMEKIRDEVMGRPELQEVKAVKEGDVYVISGHIIYWGGTSGCRGILQTAYMVKWLHPELFEDLDPKAIHQEYLTRYQGLDYDLDKHGVFVYPPLED